MKQGTPTISRLRVLVPAKDFELSKRFYSALGFRMTPAFGDTLDCELGGREFRLQDYYVKQWADNCMMVIDVEDVAAWHAHVEAVLAREKLPGARVTPPEQAGDSTVLHVWDPSGVLLVFVQ
ncbi:MAG TPA: hypothetical protein VF384_06010 [Planctomycetota bacterium]